MSQVKLNKEYTSHDKGGRDRESVELIKRRVFTYGPKP